MKKQFGKTSIKIVYIIDGFCPERRKNKFRNKGIWSDTSRKMSSNSIKFRINWY